MTKERAAALDQFEERLHYRFRDRCLLDTALTHRSFINENPLPARQDNERMEFLGDAVLELCVSDMLMKKFPDYTEGQLSQLRASIVNEQPLAEVAKNFSIGDYLLLGKGEESSGGRSKPSLLSNTFEALLAAIYLDSGFEQVSEFIRRLLSPLMNEGQRTLIYRDYKTAVQQITQNRFKETPRYTLIREYGPDHDKTFEIELSIADRITTSGAGKNKKEAEQRAAEKALQELEGLTTSDGDGPCP
jgi:ribonuclease III